jgi:hypothetical protein
VTDADDPAEFAGSLIAASQVNGTAVYNTTGEKLGVVHDVLLDRQSGQARFAIMGFGGFLGIGSRHHPLPWHTLAYDEMLGGYVVDLDRTVLEGAPSYDPEDISAWEDPTYGRQLYDYYGRPRV